MRSNHNLPQWWGQMTNDSSTGQVKLQFYLNSWGHMMMTHQKVRSTYNGTSKVDVKVHWDLNRWGQIAMIPQWMRWNDHGTVYDKCR
jgi:hypothetical protein